MAKNFLQTVCKTSLALGILLAAVARPAYALQATLVWDPSAATGVAGYMIHYGTSPHAYPWSVDAGNTNTFAVNGLQSGQAYYFAVASYDAAGQQSALSNETAVGATAQTPSSGIPGDLPSSGGGGGCALQPAGSADAALPLLMAVALLWRALRRTRTVRRD